MKKMTEMEIYDETLITSRKPACNMCCQSKVDLKICRGEKGYFIITVCNCFGAATFVRESIYYPTHEKAKMHMLIGDFS